MTAVAHGSPLTDLASTSQATRDAAAATLRTSYKQASGARWIQKLGEIQPGTAKQAVVAQLTPEQSRSLSMAAPDGSTVANYRLDDDWVLLCIYKASVDTVIKCRVSASARQVPVQPPRGYTGPWTDYFVNGRRASESFFRAGVPVGTTTVFHPNGNKALVQTHGPNGRVQGTVWYDERGAVTRSSGKP